MGSIDGIQRIDPAVEERRMEAVRRYAVLDTPPEGVFDRVVRLAARLFDVPIATVTIVDADRIWFKARHGLPEGIGRIGRDPGLCASAIMQDGPYVIPDTALDPRTLGHPLVRGAPGVRFYAAAPIVTAEGDRLGTVDIIDVRPRHLTAEQREVLTELAAMVTEQMELRLRAITAVRAEQELRRLAEREQARLQTLATTLQRTLVPSALPAVPGLEVAALYHTASVDLVGGDFYDIFHLGDRRWAFFLGDVCGKGAEAAAMTSLVRYTLRAAAHGDPDPVSVLNSLNAALLHEYSSAHPFYCTVLFGVLTVPAPGGGPAPVEVTLTGGGHPPALAIRGSGAVEVVHPAGGLLVGLMDN
ncbi:PP2C family protein-serine/threonine phosphatase, partial [Streptosporangium roseum]|uniref:PP2C family protein-serine/threonine phosphatase n=1 Tax=Streptosporangium roseum TaxID=2001 RepID=UPI00332778B6